MFRQYREIEHGEFFVVFADTSAGMGDYCACQFLSKTKLDIPLVYHSPKLATEMTNEIYPVLNKISQVTGISPMVAYERNAGGVFEIERLATLNKDGLYDIFIMPTYGNFENTEAKKLGWDTNTATRPKMLQDFKEAIDNKLLRIYDKPTINEMFSFILSKTSSTVKAQAESGAHDDLVMSAAGAYQLFQMCHPPISTGQVVKNDFSNWRI